MPLLININDLLSGAPVEWERLEFKEGWNPLAVLHTLCAFANDFQNLGGGYVVIGVAERGGQPELPPAGLSAGQVETIQKEVLNLGYRNRRIGEFLKELDLTEGRAKGIPKILRAMRANGSPMPKFETDDDRTSFLIRLPVHPQAKPIEAGQVTPQVTPQVEQLVSACDRPLSREELQERLGLQDRESFRKLYLLPALESGLVERTIPDKPNSRLQKYRLTKAGADWLQARPKPEGGN